MIYQVGVVRSKSAYSGLVAEWVTFSLFGAYITLAYMKGWPFLGLGYSAPKVGFVLLLKWLDADGLLRTTRLGF